ncbi:hypothetical protein ACLOJK_037025 [Asimina triloba]
MSIGLNVSLNEIGLVEQGSTALNKEAQERLVRQEEEDLQAGLALSREEARRSSLLVASPETSVDPTSLGLAPSSVPVAGDGADTKSHIPVFEREASEVSGREGVKARTADEQGPLLSCGAR